jgi:hypothetical protein
MKVNETATLATPTIARMTIFIRHPADIRHSHSTYFFTIASFLKKTPVQQTLPGVFRYS